MTTPSLSGGDSAFPQDDLYTGHTVWGFYIAGSTPHVWSPAQVRDLGAHGVKGAMPIVVPPQNTAWYAGDEGAAELIRLVAAARAWGLFHGSPLCLDIEEGTAEAIAKKRGLAKAVESRWAAACATYGYHPWTYGGVLWHTTVGDPSSALKWLARWPTRTPTNPKVPPNYHAWQYAGNVHGGRMDLDTFEAGRTYLNPHTLQPITVSGPLVP
jgi:hypothetical protein